MTEREGGDKFENAGGFKGGIADSYDGYSYQAQVPYANFGQIDPSTFSPMFGGQVAGQGLGSAPEPEYLHYDPKSWLDRMFYNTGSAYLFGIGAGGAFGVVNGFMTSPSKMWRIRINSVLNKSGRYGSRFGNALGALAMMYSCMEAGADKLEVDRLVPISGSENFINPIMAATLTGILYKSTKGPKTMALAGLIGGSAIAGLAAGRAAFSRGSRGGLFF